MKKIISFIVFLACISMSLLTFAQVKFPKYKPKPKSPIKNLPKAPKDIPVYKPEAPAYNLTGVYHDGKGTTLFIRQHNNTLFWFSEHEAGDFATVYKGIMIGNRITGHYWTVPKGKNSKGVAARTLMRESVHDICFSPLNLMAYNGGTEFSIIGTTPRGLSTRWTRTTDNRRTQPDNTRASKIYQDYNQGFTGVWECSDGGIYYIFECGTKLIWLGEKHHGGNLFDFANVYVGTITRHTSTGDFGATSTAKSIDGEFMDVPKGRANNYGPLKLEAPSNSIIKKVGTSRHRGKTWHKISREPLEVHIQRLRAISTDACDEMDFYGSINIEGNTRNFGEMEGNDIRPNWRHSTMVEFSGSNAEKGVMITIRDNDVKLCGGSDDLVDISPDDRSPNFLKLLVTSTYVYLLRPDGRRGRRLGRRGESITLAGDISVRRTHDPTPHGANPHSGDYEVARITFTIN